MTVKGSAVPQTGLLCPREAQLPTRRQKIGKQFGLCHSQQMLGTIRINGLETQVRAIQKLLITSKTALYGGKG